MRKIDPKKVNLKREIHEMPEDIIKLLESERLLQDYRDRPGYQQNDYIAWIEQAKQLTTRDKRIAQMLHELRKGGVYMNMDHPASHKNNHKQ